jgi:regulator of nonsense transcripts 1
MIGKDLSNDLSARRQAEKKVKEARLVFTTCTGAGLGLLRPETFDVVVIDEASQQTEPATLIPLVKGCSRAILVGDHVQLRATVQQSAVLTSFDISLFERHYNLPDRNEIAKVMLNQQYRMHHTICDFSSTEFYQGNLETAVPDLERPIPVSLFPWRKEGRLVWLECGTPEDIGRQSKANSGQVELCKRAIRLLTSTPPLSSEPSPSERQSIVILTPYTRQKELLQSSMPDFEVSSIDGFQGREADIIVFVTVRCNSHYDMGFLADMRRLNVVMTRARSGIVLIGSASTLGGGADRNGNEDSKKVWKRLIGRCHMLDCLPGTSVTSS